LVATLPNPRGYIPLVIFGDRSSSEGSSDLTCEHRHGNNGKSNDLDFLIFNYLLKAASIFSSKTDKCKVRPPFDCGIRASHCAFHVICNVQLCEILNTTLASGTKGNPQQTH